MADSEARLAERWLRLPAADWEALADAAAEVADNLRELAAEEPVGTPPQLDSCAGTCSPAPSSSTG